MKIIREFFIISYLKKNGLLEILEAYRKKTNGFKRFDDNCGSSLSVEKDKRIIRKPRTIINKSL